MGKCCGFSPPVVTAPVTLTGCEGCIYACTVIGYRCVCMSDTTARYGTVLPYRSLKAPHMLSSNSKMPLPSKSNEGIRRSRLCHIFLLSRTHPRLLPLLLPFSCLLPPPPTSYFIFHLSLSFYPLPHLPFYFLRQFQTSICHSFHILHVFQPLLDSLAPNPGLFSFPFIFNIYISRFS